MATTTGTGTQQVEIRKTSDNSLLYTVTARRNLADDPLTTEGAASFKNKVEKGYLELKVDNGAVIPSGTIPPLTKPSAPVSGSSPAYTQKVQAEVASHSTGVDYDHGNGTGDGNFSGPIYSSADFLLFPFTGLPKAASNYNVIIRWMNQGFTSGSGAFTVIVNNGSPQTVTTTAKDGGNETITLSGQSFNADNGTVRIEGLSRPHFIDFVTVTRAAD